MNSKIKTGDRVRIYGRFYDDFYSCGEFKGYVTRTLDYGNELKVTIDDKDPDYDNLIVYVHPKQCRRLVPKVRK